MQDRTCPTPYCHDGAPDPIVVVPAVVRVQKDYGRGSYYEQEKREEIGRLAVRARSSELPRECNNVTIRYPVRDEAPSSISSLFLVYEGVRVVCFLHLLRARALPQSNPLAPRFPANRHLHLSSAPTTFPLLALTPPTRINAEGVYYVSTTRPFICCVGQVDKGIKVAMGEECSTP